MKLLKKVSAGLLLSLGFLCLMTSVFYLVEPGTTLEEKQEASEDITAGIVLGVPLTAVGSWLIWNLGQHSKKELSDRLQSSFYQLIKQGNGHITVLNFAIETQLPPTAAKQYLDEKAKELNANFNTNEQGGIFYEFNL